jgi:hypothetical protein
LAVQRVHPQPAQTSRLDEKALPHGDRLYEFGVMSTEVTQHPEPKLILEAFRQLVEARNGRSKGCGIAMLLNNQLYGLLGVLSSTVRMGNEE